MGDQGVVHSSFRWGRSEEKRPLGKPRRRWEDNIKFILKRQDGEA
jgi:hypothetical protein